MEPRPGRDARLYRKQKIGVKQRTEGLTLSEESLRQKRRERIRAVSDEALIDLDEYTMMLMSKRN
jgi:hypothetical protein